MPYVLALIGFAVLILLHELGHFAAAKAVGMRVERFSLFFGPMIAKRQVGETEYGIGVLPFGGYVKITGMSLEEEFGSPDIEARAYANQPVWKRIVVIAAGPAVNLVVAFVLATVVFMGLSSHTATGGNGQPLITNKIGAVIHASAAYGVLDKGDTLVSVDGVKGGWARLHDQIRKHTCAGGTKVNGCVATSPATLVVRRDGALKTVFVRPRWNSAAREMLVGFVFFAKSAPNDLGYSVSQSVDRLWYATKRSVTAIVEFLSPKQRRQLHSVVGAYAITANQIASGLLNGLWVIAQISLALAIINLFPFLPLDGGHIFWAAVEKLRGRRISIGVIERASLVGIALIAVLFAVGLGNDLSALAGNGFGT